MLMEDTGLESAKRLKSVKPARVLVLGFLLVLILGTIALKLPISSVDGEAFLGSMPSLLQPPRYVSQVSSSSTLLRSGAFSGSV